MRGHTRTGLRIGAYVASGALALSGAVLAVTPAQADPSPVDPMGLDQGATWLAGQLTNGVFNGTCSYDCGNTIDAGLSLIDQGGHAAQVAQMKSALPGFVNGYITGEAFGDTGSTYAGPAAKSLAFAETSGLDATSYGSVNLVQRVENQVTASGPSQGRITDTSTYGDNANVLGQSFAAYGLSAAGSTKAADAVAFLLEQQCANGGFRLNFTADKDAADQTCTDNTQAQTDTTSIAVQQLDKIPASGAITSAKTAARTYLENQQKPDGSWGGGTGTEAANANSTGLAAIALGDGPAAQSAARWLRNHQATYYDLCDKLASQRGAIALNGNALSTGRTNGITSATADQWRRATAQALPALQYLQKDLTPSAPVLTGPTAYVKAGAAATMKVSGVNAGDLLCLRGTGVTSRFTATGTTLTRSIRPPAGTATRTYLLRDPDGHFSTTSLKVLGARKLSVRTSKYRVKRSHTVIATVSGLARGEHASVYYKGRFVRRAAASSTGTVKATIHVGRAKGVKRITAYGKFRDIRHGSDTIRVVR